MQFNQHIKYYLVVFVLLFSATNNLLFAQSIIDEDFIEVIEKNAMPYWDEAQADFAANKIVPEKWKDESAVIIGYKRSITFDKKVSGGWFTSSKSNVFLFETVRFKIKVQDKNSVTGFTEVYFRYGDKLDGFLAKLTKQNGEVIKVDVSDAVEVESKNDVPEFFKSFFDQNVGNETRYYKVAVPDLEVGDILEYVAYTKSKLNVTGSGYVEFDPQYEICSKKYPVMYNEISIDTDEKTFFKSLSRNGAPEFKKENSSDAGFFRYVFTDRDRATEKDVNFINPLLAYPVVKFQVIYANSDKIKGALIGSKGELKAGFTKEQLAKIAWDDYVNVDRYYMATGFTVDAFINYQWAEMKKDGVRDLPEEKFIQNAYYRIRNHVLFQSSYLSDKVFAYILGSLLYQRDIKSELVISVSNKVGLLKDVLFDNEIKYLIKVGNKYYFNCTDHSNPDELTEPMLGNEAYIIKEPNKKTGVQEIIPVTLPDAPAADNTVHQEINATYDPVTGKMNVVRTSTYTGISKAKQIDNVVKFTNYIFDDFKVYSGASPLDKMGSRQIDEYYKSVAAIKEEFKTAKPEQVQNELDKDFRNKVTYKNFRVVTDGRALNRKQLSEVTEFEIEDVTKRAGKKLLVNLTGLVGSQLQIDKDERNRTKDIQVGYARTLTWKISMPVPAGYAVKGLKEMNKTVDNEAGKFVCEAKEENGNVIIFITKVYKKKDMPRENWDDMLAFVDAAYNTTFKYILLQPK
jgi:hypothetical protein